MEGRDIAEIITEIPGASQIGDLSANHLSLVTLYRWFEFDNHATILTPQAESNSLLIRPCLYCGLTCWSTSVVECHRQPLVLDSNRCRQFVSRSSRQLQDRVNPRQGLLVSHDFLARQQ